MCNLVAESLNVSSDECECSAWLGLGVHLALVLGAIFEDAAIQTVGAGEDSNGQQDAEQDDDE